MKHINNLTNCAFNFFFFNFIIKRKYFHVIYFCIAATLLLSCNDQTYHAGGIGGYNNVLECIVDYRYPKIEYDYMYKSDLYYPDSFYTFHNDYLQKFRNAFSERGNVFLNFDTSFNSQVLGTRCNWRILGKDLDDTLFKFGWDYRQHMSGWFYLASIDSFSIDTEPITMGITYIFYHPLDSLTRRRGYAFVYIGKIRNRARLVTGCNSGIEFMHYNTAHELGHLFGPYIEHEGPHTGSFASVCLMRTNAPICDPDPIKSFLTICDTHTCEIFNGATLVTNLNQISSGVAQGNKNSYNLNFELSVNKSTYLEGEPIILKMTMKNVGINVDSISHPSFKYFFNALKIQNNKSSGFYTFKVHANYIPPIPYHKLNPGESISIELELQKYYGTSEIEAGPFIIYYFNEDIYSVQFKSSDDINKRQYQSNIINFEVKKPENVNADVFNELIKIYNMKEWNEKLPEGKRYNKEWAIERYNAIINLMYKYPPNIYTEKIYDLYNAAAASLDIKDSVIENNLWFINTYPDSYFNQSIVYHTLRIANKYRNGESSADEIIDLIIQNVPNTRASRIAEEYRISKKYKQ